MKKFTSLIISLILLMSAMPVLLVASSNSTAITPLSSGVMPDVPTGIQPTSYYTNSDLVTLWVRINGSDPGFEYEGGLSPTLGMNYFKTLSTCPRLSDYNYSSLTDSSVWGPADTAVETIFTTVDVITAAAAADAAVSNPRIKYMVWDDFPVGTQSPANMSAIYSALHHEDANLTQGSVKLMLVVYELGYFDQSPYTWAQIKSYFDGFSYWYYPTTYANTFTDFSGYEDCFMDLRAKVNDASKEYWLGYYLHFYNGGSYPSTLSYWWAGEALRLIEYGYASKLHVLENQWIVHNPMTASILKNYLEDEYDQGFVTVFDGVSGVTTNATGATMATAIDSIAAEASYSGYRFISRHYQDVLCLDFDYADPRVQDVNSGENVHFVSVSAGDFSFVALANAEYRVYDRALTAVIYTTDQHITSPTVWANKEITFKSKLVVNASLTIRDSTVRFDNYAYEMTAKNGTVPAYGITLDTNGLLKIYNSTIEPVNRLFPYHMKMRNQTSFGLKENRFVNSTLAGWAGVYAPTNWVYIYDSHFWMPKPDGGTFAGFMAQGPGMTNEVRVARCTFIYPDANGFYNYWMPGDLPRPSVHMWTTEYITMIGGQYGVFVDQSYTGADFIPLFKHMTVGPLSSQIQGPSPYEKFFVQSNTGDGGNVEFYEDLTVYATGGSVNYDILNSNGILITQKSQANNTHTHIEVLEATWTYGSSVNYVNTWPLKVHVTSDTPAGELRMAVDRSSALSESSYLWGVPRLLEMNSSTVLAYAGENGIELTLQPNQILSTGGWLLDGCYGVREPRIAYSLLYSIPQVLHISVVSEILLEIERASYDNASSVEITVNASGNGSVIVTASDLLIGNFYHVELDGSVVIPVAAPGSNGAISYTYSGPWSEHTIAFVLQDAYGISLLFGILPFMVVVVVLVGVIGVVIGGTEKKK